MKQTEPNFLKGESPSLKWVETRKKKICFINTKFNKSSFLQLFNLNVNHNDAASLFGVADKVSFQLYI